jgi:D-sedoheptulose 7-phosphate isomerase
MRPVPAVSIAAEPAIITAVANDVGVEAVFTRALIAHAGREDIAIGFSTSGSSPNVLHALGEARKRGLMTVGLAGYNGGRMVAEGLADHALAVPSDYIPRIQEVQASLYHVLRRRIDELWSSAHA